MKRFLNQHCLITGGTGAIGQAIAKQFIKEGATVWLTGRKAIKAGDSIAKKIGNNCHYWPLSVHINGHWQAISDHFSQNNITLNVLVNNAGIEYPSSANPDRQNPEDCTLEDWKTVFETNIESVFLGCQFGIKWMKTSGGAIVNIASRSGLVGVPVSPAYAASKAAVCNFTKSVALYCASKHYPIRCNTINPAAIDSKMWDKELGTDKERNIRKAQLSSAIPIGRMGEPEDIVEAVLYFASDKASFVTGAELTIDGGIMAGSAASADNEAESSSNA